MGLTQLNNLAKANITSETKTQVTKNKLNFKRQARKLGQPQRWRLKLETTPLPYPEAMALYAEMSQLDGVYNVVTLPNPFPAIGTMQSALCEQSSQAGDRLVTLASSGSQPNSKPLSAGEFIQFASHHKVYQVRHYDEASAQVTLYPNLKHDVMRGESVRLGKNVVFYVFSDDDDIELEVSAGRPIPVSIELVEVTQ